MDVLQTHVAHGDALVLEAEEERHLEVPAGEVVDPHQLERVEQGVGEEVARGAEANRQVLVHRRLVATSPEAVAGVEPQRGRGELQPRIEVLDDAGAQPCFEHGVGRLKRQGDGTEVERLLLLGRQRQLAGADGAGGPEPRLCDVERGAGGEEEPRRGVCPNLTRRRRPCGVHRGEAGGAAEVCASEHNQREPNGGMVWKRAFGATPAAGAPEVRIEDQAET